MAKAKFPPPLSLERLGEIKRRFQREGNQDGLELLWEVARAQEQMRYMAYICEQLALGKAGAISMAHTLHGQLATEPCMQARAEGAPARGADPFEGRGTYLPSDGPDKD